MTSLNEEQVLSNVEKLYGISGELTPLVGHVEINYKLTTSDGSKYVVKISDYPGTVDLHLMQCQIFEVLHKSYDNGPFPTVKESLKGNSYEIISIDGKELFLRILSWLGGTLLNRAEHTPELLFDIGQVLARMDLILNRANHINIKNQYYEWDLQYALFSKPLVHHISDPSVRRSAAYFFQQFEFFVTPQFPNLRKGIIHSDANDYNILVHGSRVSGIIDFGDCVYTPVINELAIALTYALMDIDDPIAMASEMIRGYHSIYPLEKNEVELLYCLIGARLAVSLTKSAELKNINPDNKYLTVSEEPAHRLLQTWMLINPIRFTNALKRACGFGIDEISTEPVLKERAALVNPSLSLSYNSPIKMASAAFQYMYSTDGSTYLDCVNNICHVGHSHPKVVEAASRQMASLNTNTRYLYDQLNEYAAKLAGKFPDPLNIVYLVNSGSEAGDLAQRIVRTVTGSINMIVVDHAYHGNTISGIELSPYKYEGKGGGGGADNIYKITIPDCFRGEFKYDEPNAGKKYAKEINEVIEHLRNKDEKIAGFICESIIGCGGQVMLPAGYLKNIYDETRKSGGLCIADEVQVGFGRLGEKFWGFELHGVIPDIVVMGKPMGNGHPIAGVITTREIADAFNNGMEYFSSFGGNPVSCEVGKAVLEVIEDEGLQEHANETGGYLKDLFTNLQNDHPIIGDVRGNGFFLGIELIEDPELTPATSKAKETIEKMKARQILLSTDGPNNNVLKIKPPMPFNRSNAEQLVENLNSVLMEIAD